jgi:hypothetical protein
MSVQGVRRDKAALSSGCKSHPATLQKPSESVSRIGDSASVQAVTRVNAEQASKRTMRRHPTTLSGKADTAGVNERRSTPSRCAGVVATACTQGKRTQHGKPHGVVSDDQLEAREGQAGRLGPSCRSPPRQIPSRAANYRRSGSPHAPTVKKRVLCDRDGRFWLIYSYDGHDTSFKEITEDEYLKHLGAKIKSLKQLLRSVFRRHAGGK